MKQDFKVQLHIHPYFDSYSLEDIIKTAKKKNLDAAALERLDYQIFPDLIKMSKNLPSRYDVDNDNNIMQIYDKEDGKKLYLLRAIELNTKQNKFHLIVIGDSQVKPYSPIEETIENALKNECLIIFDHPFAENKNLRKDINPEKEEDVEMICKKYSRNIFLEWNAYCIPWVRKVIGGGDVNKKVVKLSEKLAKQGYNVPVVTDSDIHARYKGALDEMGKASINVKKISGNSGKAIISSLKENIKAGSYKNDESYISLKHFLFNFGLPLVVNKVCKKFCKKPRA